MQVHYKPSFIRMFKKLQPALQEEASEKIELFKEKKNHKQLKIHKLHGRLKNKYSFSVNYQYCIVFQKTSKDEVVLLTIGDHAIYH